MEHEWDVVIIGGGAAGIFAAIRSAERKLKTLLLEKNSKLGVKILISGGTRCNLTHDASAKEMLRAFKSQSSFLRHAIGNFGPDRVVELIESNGVPTKVEATGKVFPESDRASDVVRALRRRLSATNCEIKLKTPVSDVTKQGDRFRIDTPTEMMIARNLVITTGGKSYPECGTTGDGYAWAEALGHAITPTFPALAPITSQAAWVSSLQGVSLGDILLHVNREGKTQVKQRGAMLFTHFGISGPTALDVSRVISQASIESGQGSNKKNNDLGFTLACNLLPDFTPQQCDRFWQEAACESGGKRVGKVLGALLPKRLADSIAYEILGLPAELKVSELSKKDRQRIRNSLLGLTIPVNGTRGYKKAEVTAGGIELAQVNPKTMESKLCSNLFFAGEILDVDGPIGGYNFQAAFSTGWLAGSSIDSR